MVVGVVDPGVGTAREPVVVAADGRWYVGPGNGLFDVVAARSEAPARWWRITRAPEGAAATFHGRDLFAPVAAALARGGAVPGEPIDVPAASGAEADRAAVIYIDGFGNAMTGLRAGAGERRALRAGGCRVPAGRTFADAAPGEPLWLANSIGLVEVVVNRGRADAALGLAPGTTVAWAEER
ncbi:MAG: SAM-dependent chlorinase/fluorinase [Halofilum sp. (in: g-proteobacteria)]|nr:SAM-dependent chlorinase/fluorinase [Halofilum sp. (in: g-proteobacteria)]